MSTALVRVVYGRVAPATERRCPHCNGTGTVFGDSKARSSYNPRFDRQRFYAAAGMPS